MEVQDDDITHYNLSQDVGRPLGRHPGGPEGRSEQSLHFAGTPWNDRTHPLFVTIAARVIYVELLVGGGQAKRLVLARRRPNGIWQVEPRFNRAVLAGRLVFIARGGAQGLVGVLSARGANVKLLLRELPNGIMPDSETLLAACRQHDESATAPIAPPATESRLQLVLPSPPSLDATTPDATTTALGTDTDEWGQPLDDALAGVGAPDDELATLPELEPFGVDTEVVLMADAGALPAALVQAGIRDVVSIEIDPALGGPGLAPNVVEKLRGLPRVLLFIPGASERANLEAVVQEAYCARALTDAGVQVRLVRLPEMQGTSSLADFVRADPSPASALPRLLSATLAADPFVRVQEMAEMPATIHRGKAALELVRDPSFAAALDLVPQAIFDLVAAALERAAGISRPAIVELRETFRERTRAQPVLLTDSGPATPDPDVSADADALLRDPNLDSRFVASGEQDGLVGQRDGLMIVLLVFISRLLMHPISLIVKAALAAGKNALVDAVVRYMPGLAVLKISDLSPKALQYMGSEDLRHRVIYIAEHEGGREAEDAMRVMMSEGELVRLVATADGTKPLVVEGPCAFVTTTTAVTLNPENESRVLELALDESPAQTRRILAAQARRAAHPPTAADLAAADRRHQVWQTALSTLVVHEAVVPGAEQLAEKYSVERLRARRDFARLLQFTRAHALLHQYQRELDGEGRVVATRADEEVALTLTRHARASANPRLAGLAARLRAKFGDDEFTAPEVARTLGYDPATALRILKFLANQFLVAQARGSWGRQAGSWRLTEGL
jgi:hypothetical protein